jgi:uncharacterized protein YkwD
LLAAVAAAGLAAGNPTEVYRERLEVPRGPLEAEQLHRVLSSMVERINDDRSLADLPPVEWDAAAADVADQFCARALRDGTVGHYTLSGLSPLHRNGLSGVTDLLRENICAWMWSRATYDWTEGEIVRILHDFQDDMLAEHPPNDGHRQAILDPYATHVGIGLAVSANEIRYAQEFVARHVDVEPIPEVCGPDDRVILKGKVREPDKYILEFICVFHEPPPEPLTVDECRQRMTYAFPEQRKDLRPYLPEGYYYLSDHGRGEFKRDEETGEFSAEVPPFRGEGWYGILTLLAAREPIRGHRQFGGSWSFVRVEAPLPPETPGAAGGGAKGGGA